MVPPAAYGGQHGPQQAYPALYLYPLNDSFVPKHISLVGGQRVKIGRQTNPKTAPGEKNGFFDSKVLSRQHAEIWEDGGKIYIKDVKSSNGTFINGERLSPEGVESDPYELKSDDIVEFGIDIVGEDNKTIIHHKVAARSVCVFCEQDAHVAARAEQHQQQQQHLLQQQQQQQYAQQHSLIGSAQPPQSQLPNQFSFVPGPQQRRPGPGPVPQGLAGIGGMGGAMRPPGKSGLSFEHILSRLQGELQKSRETGSELHSLSGSISDIHDVLGGNLPSNIPPYPASLPPVRPTRQPSPSQPPHPHQDSHRQQGPSPPPPSDQQPSASSPPAPGLISQLQNQLRDTQTSLAEHANKVRALEEILADQQIIRKEVHDLRQLVESRRREISFDHHPHDPSTQHQEGEDVLLEPRGSSGFDDDDDIQHIGMLDEADEVDDEEDDDDDVRSIATIIPHELERVEEEDEEQLAAAERGDDDEPHRIVDELETEEEVEDGRGDPIDPHREREGHERDREREAERQADALRKQEDLNVGRPRTPEPSFGLRDSSQDSPSSKPNVNVSSPRTRSGTLLASSSPTSTSPHTHTSASPHVNGVVTSNGVTNDDMLDQIFQLSSQLNVMVKLTSSMEAQHNAAQDIIKGLEGRLKELEKAVSSGVAVKEDEKREKKEKEKEEEGELTRLLTEWKKSYEGQWSCVKEEWEEERERMRRAKEEWEGMMNEKIDRRFEQAQQQEKEKERQQQQQVHSSATMTLVKDLGNQKTEMERMKRDVDWVVNVVRSNTLGFGIGNGDAVKHGGGSGLVTPPSPRSQSSDSSEGRSGSRRSRKRSRGRSGRKVVREEEDDEEGAGPSGSGPSGSGVDAVKVTEGTTNLRTRHDNPDDGTKSTITTAVQRASRAYPPLSSVLQNLVEKERISDYEDNDAETGSTTSSVLVFGSEEEVEEGKKVPGPVPIRTGGSERVKGGGKSSSMMPPGGIGTPDTAPSSLAGSVVIAGDGGGGDDSSDVKGSMMNMNMNTKSNTSVNFQTAGAVVVLAVAAAAVFYKIRSE